MLVTQGSTTHAIGYPGRGGDTLHRTQYPAQHAVVHQDAAECAGDASLDTHCTVTIQDEMASCCC